MPLHLLVQPFTDWTAPVNALYQRGNTGLSGTRLNTANWFKNGNRMAFGINGNDLDPQAHQLEQACYHATKYASDYYSIVELAPNHAIVFHKHTLEPFEYVRHPLRDMKNPPPLDTDDFYVILCGPLQTSSAHQKLNAAQILGDFGTQVDAIHILDPAEITRPKHRHHPRPFY